jgi:hypothetical protein
MITRLVKNFTAGRKGLKPVAIVIHIMEGTLNGTESWFNTPSSQVSSHYGIGKSGEVRQWVKEEVGSGTKEIVAAINAGNLRIIELLARIESRLK